MSSLVIAPNLEISDEMKDAEINGVVIQNENDGTLGATTASPSEPDSDAIKMFVGQIPRHWNETDCRRLFETYGAVFSCNILRDKSTQSSKGCCFVTFYHRKDAIEAQGALHNIKVIDGMHHPVQMKPADTENRNERKLFIGQLSKRHNEEELRTIFSKYGMIEDCSVLRDQDGKSRGCAFVTFTNRSCAVVATKEMHHSQTMEGCAAPLVVKFADTQKDKDVKQKSGVFVGGSTSPKSALLGNLNPALIQQLGGGGQNIQAVASLLSLLGGQQGQPVAQQPNVLGILGSVLSALSKLTENGSEESSSSAKPSASSAAHSEHVQNPQIPNIPQNHPQHNNLSQKAFPNSSSSSSSSSATSSTAAHHQQLAAQFLPQAAVAQTAQGQLDPFTQAHLAQIQQHNQLLALQGYAVQQQNSQAQAGFHVLPYSTGSPDSATNTESSGSEEHLNVQQQYPYQKQQQHYQQIQKDQLYGSNAFTGVSLRWNSPAAAAQSLYVPISAHHSLQMALAQTALGLGGGLAGAKTTSPVAASLPTQAQTIALTPYGQAAVDPYQSAIFQQHQHMALLANLQAAASNVTATSQASSIVGNGDVKGPEGSNLFIYHLPQDFGDADLLNTFVPFGAVLSAKVFIDKVTNLSKCFGFVSFDNPSSAANAIQAMNGFQIGSKRLKVQLKVERGNPYNR